MIPDGHWRSPGVVTGCFFNKLPTGFKVLDLVKQIRVVCAVRSSDFLCNPISQSSILGPEFIIIGLPCFQQGFIPQIHQVAYLRRDPGKGLASYLHLSSRGVTVTVSVSLNMVTHAQWLSSGSSKTEHTDHGAFSISRINFSWLNLFKVRP